MVERNDTVLGAEGFYNFAIIKRPCWISVHKHKRLSRSFIDIVHPMAVAKLKVSGLKWIFVVFCDFIVYHLRPIIMVLRPEPMPRIAIESPFFSLFDSLANAKDNGTATDPVLPRVEISL